MSTTVEPQPATELDAVAITALRALAMDAVENAQSGHPGAPLGLAPLAYTLGTRWLAHDPADPAWPDRDRLVLSAGHASMLLYGLLHLTGYELPLEELQRFRQLGSMTPGHPEYGDAPGVETTTGPLGQGFGNAVGMALAERLLAARFNQPGHTVIDHRTVVIASDGDLMEGVAAEAASLAGHLGLDRLVVFWDDNGITIDGSTEKTFVTEDVLARFAAYGWHTLSCDDVEDPGALDRAIGQAFANEGAPTLVRVPTVIGWPAPGKQGTAAAHGSPLGADEIAAAKETLGWPHGPFEVPDEVYAHADQRPRGGALRREWDAAVEAYRAAHPESADELDRVLAGRLPEGWHEDLPSFETGQKLATRKASEQVINALAPRVPELVGGSADLAASNNTTIADGGDVARHDYTGRNLHFGVREHGMAATLNGLCLHGGLRPFGGTFLIFSDYLRPSLRLAALMHQPTVLVFTHDSIGLGEDGPTHQPVEHLAAVRAIPNVDVIRPADATETVGAWRCALERSDGPTALALTRQGLPVLEGTDADAVARGAYRVRDAAAPDLALVATGSEVSLAVDAADHLAGDGVSAIVVSMPSWKRFAERDAHEREAVLPSGLPTLSVEAATSFGWSRWADAHVALDQFGASAPAGDVFAHFGFTPERVAGAARTLVSGASDR
ncbi:transketolase [Egibacter rhizosphaerae]|uniref:transketolase n=1 Tax=Egibacter rhizosphaerae TaxID=1670831 RepID=UPI001F0E95B8|nr:transketolase [Egibacter rhizosphaerae]